MAIGLSKNIQVEMDSKYLFNNEAVGIIAMQATISECREITYAKAMLILPFLLHEDTVASLKRSNSVQRSIEEMMTKKLGNFANFDSRYYSMLPISLNVLMILRDMGAIKITKDKIYSSANLKNISIANLGKRAKNIIEATTKLSLLLNSENDSSLYLKLRITL